MTSDGNQTKEAPAGPASDIDKGRGRSGGPAGDAPHGGGGWKLAAVGLAAGFMSALFGIGGGALMVPILTIWLGTPVKQAIASSLVAVIGFAIVGVAFETARHPENVHWDFALILAVSSFAGVWFGKRIYDAVPEKPIKLIFTAVALFGVAKFTGLFEFGSNGDSALYERLLHAFGWSADGAGGLAVMVALASIVGCAGGVLSILLGIGGGVIYVPALAVLFAAFASNVHWARATSMAAIIFTSILGGYLHYRAGNVSMRVVKGVLFTGIMGSTLGVLVANALTGGLLEALFAGFLALLAVQMAVSAFRDGKTTS